MAKVCVRRKDSGSILLNQAAASICYEYGLYEVKQPSIDLPATYADDWWSTYEGALIPAVRALEAGAADVAHWRAVLRHIRATWPRHPDFERDVAAQKAEDGVAPIAGDDLERLRKAVLEDRSIVANARFALLRRAVGTDPFLLNDKGFASFAERSLGVFFPLSRQIGVLMAVGAGRCGDGYDQAPYAERVLNNRGIAYLNARCWLHEGIRMVIAHPDDERVLTGIGQAKAGLKVPRHLRPYQGSRERMLAWAD